VTGSSDHKRTSASTSDELVQMEARSTLQPSRRPLHTASRSPRDGVPTNRHSLITVDVVKGPSGFGFTLADTEDGK